MCITDSSEGAFNVSLSYCNRGLGALKLTLGSVKAQIYKYGNIIVDDSLCRIKIGTPVDESFGVVFNTYLEVGSCFIRSTIIITSNLECREGPAVVGYDTVLSFCFVPHVVQWHYSDFSDKGIYITEHTCIPIQCAGMDQAAVSIKDG